MTATDPIDAIKDCTITERSLRIAHQHLATLVAHVPESHAWKVEGQLYNLEEAIHVVREVAPQALQAS